MLLVRRFEPSERLIVLVQRHVHHSYVQRVSLLGFLIQFDEYPACIFPAPCHRVRMSEVGHEDGTDCGRPLVRRDRFIDSGVNWFA